MAVPRRRLLATLSMLPPLRSSAAAPSGVWGAILLGLAAASPLVAQDAGGSPAVSSGAAAVKAPTSLFALPWEITFDKIDRAMAQRTYRLRQVRRVLDRTRRNDVGNAWVALVEELIHGAQPGSQGSQANQPELFRLELVGMENVALSPAQFEQARKLHQSKAGFLYHFQSFRVFDVAEAAKNYSIAFLGVSARAQRPVYRVAVYSRLGGRSGWLLELDLETGYPLYRGEYETTGDLVGEVEVVEFDPNYSGSLPQPTTPAGVTRYGDPAAAALALQLPSRVVPEPDVLPRGYVFGSAKTVINAYTGKQEVVLIYSDGIDQVFVIASSDPRESLGEGHVCAFHRDAAGVAQASFVDRGLSVLLVGRGTDAAFRSLTYRMYAQIAQ
jgi:hypothetical protein